MKTAVRVKFRGGKMVVFHKSGTKSSLCKVTKIKIKGKSFMGRRGGRTLCGPSTGKNSAASKAARAQFKRMVKGGKRSRRKSYSRRRKSRR
jgi:hypothetical protein